MDGVTPSVRAAERLLEEKPYLARAVTDAFYEARPELLREQGEYGRGKCLQDMHYNLEHLAPAVDLGRPDLFAEYARWLDGLLRARNVTTDQVVLCFELTERFVRERFPAEEAEAVATSLHAGLAALEPAPEAGA